MNKIVRCPNCQHIHQVKTKNLLPGKLRERLQERLWEIEAELGGLQFEEGILFEQQRALRRERHTIEQRLSGKPGKKVSS
jgi:hypothetical protein